MTRGNNDGRARVEGVQYRIAPGVRDVNIGSTAGMVGKDRRIYAGTTMGGATIDYHAAKGGVINMTRDMAVYLARYNIRVNAPGASGGNTASYSRSNTAKEFRWAVWESMGKK